MKQARTSSNKMELCPSDPALRKRYYIGAAIGAVLLLIIVILSVMLASSGHKHNRCELSDVMPDAEALLEGSKNVPSIANTDLANMVGYLFVYGEGFLPVSLTEFLKGKERLIFKSDCASLSWNYRLVNYNTTIDLTGINLKLDEQVKGGLKCDLKYNEFSLPKSKMFSCGSRMAFVCRSKDSAGYMEPVAELVLESFKFELDGNPVEIKGGYFDKPPLDYSCQAFPWTK